MDQLKKLTGLFVKYRWAVLVLLLGLCFMLLPTSSEPEAEESEPIQTVQEETDDLEARLQAILSGVQGVGDVEVLLTLQTGSTTCYRIDEDGTVIITDADRGQNGLVETVAYPQYRGAVVVCQGADSAAVRLSVVEAVASATGLSTDRITVLKMK